MTLTACQSLTTSCMALPVYASAVSRLGPRATQEIAGVTVTHEDVAQAMTVAYARQRANFPVICGAGPRAQHEQQQRFWQAAMRDAGQSFGIEISPRALKWIGIVALGVFVLMFGGPLALLLCIGEVIFGWLLEQELERKADVDKAMQEVCAAA